jgi:hypothetical protein
MSFQIEQASFTASEAEIITGINSDQQRNLRRHRYLLKSKGGWTRFTLEEVARLLIIGQCSERGIPPATSSVVASVGLAAQQILGFAAELPGTIVGAERLRGAKSPLRIPDHRQRRFLVAVGRHADNHKLTNDLNRLFSAKSEIGTCVVVDLKALGALLHDRAGKPLICITERVERMD